MPTAFRRPGPVCGCIRSAPIVLFLFAAAAASADEAFYVPLDEIRTYAREDYRAEVTECDRLAAHPSDPDAVSEGVSRAAMDLPAAVAACEKAVADDAGNPRLNYQLARAYGYSGLHEEAAPFRERAVRAGYPQSLFVMGYILVTGWGGMPANPCYGGALIRRSAEAGRYAGLIGFPYYAVKDTFSGCEGLTTNVAELGAMLDAAEARGADYYQGLLIDLLRDRIAVMEH
ncbi:MAG: hypothetical protein P8172_02520 [Gammaproteobacteria bacterium]